MSGTIPTNQVSIPGVGVVGAGQLNTYAQTDQTTSQLRGFIGVSGMCVILQGFNAPGDGGSGLFYWNSGAGFVDDGVNTIVPPASGSGAWLRLSPSAQLFIAATAPATPPAGSFYVYMDTADNKLKAKGPSGTITVLANP